MDETRLHVGIAGLRTAGPGEVLVAVGLGSCVAVAIHDGLRQRGSLVHIMLPQRSWGVPREGENLHKYADFGVPAAIEALECLGCHRRDMTAKIAGGARIFELGHGELPDIGSRNVEAVMRLLLEVKIPLIGGDTGGREGRTVEFRPVSGELVVRTVRAGRRVI